MDYLERVGQKLGTTFDSSANATVHQIRRYGLGAWLAGLLVLVVLALSIPLLERSVISTEVAMAYASASLVAFGLMAIGCYKALTGKNLKVRVNDYEASLARVIKLQIAILLSITIPALIVVAFLYFLHWIGVEPNRIFQPM